MLKVGIRKAAVKRCGGQKNSRSNDAPMLPIRHLCPEALLMGSPDRYRPRTPQIFALIRFTLFRVSVWICRFQRWI